MTTLRLDAVRRNDFDTITGANGAANGTATTVNTGTVVNNVDTTHTMGGIGGNSTGEPTRKRSRSEHKGTFEIEKRDEYKKAKGIYDI